MYLSRPIRLVTLFKCTAILSPRVIKLFNGQHRKQLLKLNNISLFKSLRTLTTNHVLQYAVNPEEIELTPIPPEFEKLANNDLEISNNIRVILMEYEMHKLTDSRMPSALTTNHMQDLLEKKGYISRKKYLNYLFLKEVLPLLDKERKEKRRIKRLQEKEQLQEQGNDHIHYGLNNNNILLYIRERSMNRFHLFRQAYALLFGQPIVFDLGFEKNMNKREVLNMIEQLAMSFHENKIHNDPYNIYFTNLSFQSQQYSQLELTMPQITTDDNNMITVSDKSYLDLFPKEKLVYLSPNAKQTLEKYDHNSIYIIGGIVDKSQDIPLTMAKAKREGIRMAKLPIDNYLMWGSGSRKCLTLNHIFKILLDMKYTNDWKKAFGAIPSRKLKRVEDARELEAAKQERLRKRVEQLERRDKTMKFQKF